MSDAADSIAVRLCRTDEIPVDGGKAFDAQGIRVAVFNVGGRFHATSDLCSHEKESLAEGWLEGDSVECPRHGAQFSLITGEALSLPATEPIDVYRVEARGDELYVHLPTQSRK